MPTFYAEDFKIDVDEFLSACSSREKEELIDALIEDGYLKENCKVDYKYELLSVPESFYIDAIDKIKGKWNMLTQEEEEIILKIASRF
jgi:tRNA A37 threonylcarbamoyladenosine dehydratase